MALSLNFEQIGIGRDLCVDYVDLEYASDFEKKGHLSVMCLL